MSFIKLIEELENLGTRWGNDGRSLDDILVLVSELEEQFDQRGVACIRRGELNDKLTADVGKLSHENGILRNEAKKHKDREMKLAVAEAEVKTMREMCELVFKSPIKRPS